MDVQYISHKVKAVSPDVFIIRVTYRSKILGIQYKRTRTLKFGVVSGFDEVNYHKIMFSARKMAEQYIERLLSQKGKFYIVDGNLQFTKLNS